MHLAGEGQLGSGGAGGGGESGFHVGHQLTIDGGGLEVCGLHWGNLSQGEGGTGSLGLALWVSEGSCKPLSQVGYAHRTGGPVMPAGTLSGCSCSEE